jgi:aryl-alcohol dehydrogenase-like predicted oxidoreductase
MRKTQLRTSPRGATGMGITPVGFGAWAIGGGGWEFGWGPRRIQLSRHLAMAARLRSVAERIVATRCRACPSDRDESSGPTHRALERGCPAGTTPGTVAVAWTLHYPAVHGAITGFRRPAQVDPILAAAGLELTHEDITEIEAAD